MKNIHNDQLQRYLDASLNLYGAIAIFDLLDLINHYEDMSMTENDLKLCVMDLMDQQKNENIIFRYNLLVRMSDFLDPSRQLEDAKSLLKRQKSIPRYRPSKIEFLKYTDSSYIEPLRALEVLEHFMIEHQVLPVASQQDIQDDVRELYHKHYFGLLSDNYEFELTSRGYTFRKKAIRQQFLKLLIEMFRDSRLPENNGHTQNELSKSVDELETQQLNPVESFEDGIRRIHKDSKYFKELIDLELLLWPDHTFDELYVETKNSPDYFFGLIGEGRLNGFIQIAFRYEYVNGTSTSPVGYIEGIYVREEVRQKGFGKKLVEYAIDFVQKQGCSEIASDVEEENCLSQQFHKRVGFTETERVIYYSRKLS